ncbi:MAG: threonine--tRNA ligase [Patescibacteria group bacterium]|nr:threonine--tRNA ligase [Patescibacteria group bacterium]
MDKAQKLYNIRHSLAHILASAVLEMFPKANLGVGPVVENGFYYDFLLPRPLTPDDIKKLEKRMRALIAEKLPFERSEMTIQEAKKFFADRGQTFKVELINDIEKFGTTKADEILNQEAVPVGTGLDLSLQGKTSDKVSLYKTGKFVDLCRGPHVENTSQIHADAFKLDKVSGAYWRGDQNNPQMQRVYGLAFETKEELEAYLKQREEAERRDHKKLGVALDLFTFSEKVGAGLPLWTPKGTLVRNLLDDCIWELRKKVGYQKVEIPHITKKDLYETSGHWAKFKDDLFKIQTRDGHLFAMKPMNCPHHTQIYARKLFSYREMPQRYANTTMVYRDEQSGELSGLSRVLSITQDDAHVFCRFGQVKKELGVIWDKIVVPFYKSFGFDLKLRLSLHDPQHPEKYLGSPEKWKEAENILRELAKERKMRFYEAPGEAAFYGPKLDFMATDSLGREWQVATIQLDMNMPERFDLTCVNEEGQKERIVMIHAAIMGSIERFLSILIEHTAGAFPLWLSPVQVMVLPISRKQNAYAKQVVKALIVGASFSRPAAGSGRLKAAPTSGIEKFRVELDNRDESIGKKIREATMQKIPYMVIIGEKEMKLKKISARTREGIDLGILTLDKFTEKLESEISRKK